MTSINQSIPQYAKEMMHRPVQVIASFSADKKFIPIYVKLPNMEEPIKLKSALKKDTECNWMEGENIHFECTYEDPYRNICRIIHLFYNIPEHYWQV